jgi:Restriction endonuclease BglII
VKIRIVDAYSYRHAEAILKAEFRTERGEIVAALEGTAWVPMAKPKVRKRKGKVVARLTIDQVGTNKAIEAQFAARGWQVRPRIISSSESQLASDFKKGKVQVEVQLGNMARWYTDVFKFLLSYSANDIEVGVLVVPMQEVAAQIDENVAHFQRVVREIPHAKMGITLPIWVVGLGLG